MKRKLTFLIFLFLSITVNAQFKDYSYKIGLQGNFLIPGNEFSEEKYNPSLLFRPHIAFQLNNVFDLDLGINYGWNQGEDYGDNKYYTTLIPIDLRLAVSPFNFESVNPYLYLGLGANFWSLDTKPIFVTNAVKDENGINGLGLAGLGFEVALSNNWILDITGGLNMFSDDKINGDASNIKDNFMHEYDRYINIGVGIAYVASSTCNLDMDSDGLTECEEITLGSAPEIADTDGDGLMDGEEVNLHKTALLKADTDADGLMDGEEVKTVKTDPNKADTDGDGLNDGFEVKTHKTDPLIVDTDKDGLKDGQEVSEYKTDPLNADTDKDLLKDGEEVVKHQTNPLEADTDKGTIKDGEEVAKATNPLDPKDDVAAEKPIVEETFVLDGILFETNSSKIAPKSNMDILDNAAVSLSIIKRKVEIAGHTDIVGKHAYNVKLSLARANSVKDYLVKKGIDASRISVKGYGPDQPAASNDSVEGRAKNRRIEFKMMNAD